MKRILITGASGFIGRHVVASLADQGYEIHAVDLRRGPSAANVIWHETNLLDPNYFADTSTAFRLVCRTRKILVFPSEFGLGCRFDRVVQVIRRSRWPAGGLRRVVR